MLSDIHVQVEQGRFGLTTKNSSKALVLRDLAMSCFVLLEHTPLRALGLNLDLEFELGSEVAWHDVGNRLAPKPDWQGILENPGMRAILMEGKRAGCVADKINIRVQPTPRFAFGVFVGFNQHYALETPERKTVREWNAEAMRILQEDWNSFVRYALKSAIQLIAGTTESTAL